MNNQNTAREAAPNEVERGDEPTRDDLAFRPNVDIIESNDELTLLVDLPGADPNDVDIDFDRGVLTLSAPVSRRIPQGARVALAEYDVAGFRRSFRVTQPIDTASISAESRQGVLIVHLPKAPEIRPRKIPVLAS